MSHIISKAINPNVVGINRSDMAETCSQWVKWYVIKRKPFVRTDFPKTLQFSSCDINRLSDVLYLNIDYLLRFFEKLKFAHFLTAFLIVTKLKELFSRFGILEIVRYEYDGQ